MARDSVLLQETKDLPALRQPGYWSNSRVLRLCSTSAILYPTPSPRRGCTEDWSRGGTSPSQQTSGLDTSLLRILPTGQDFHFPDGGEQLPAVRGPRVQGCLMQMGLHPVSSRLSAPLQYEMIPWGWCLRRQRKKPRRLGPSHGGWGADLPPTMAAGCWLGPEVCLQLSPSLWGIPVQDNFQSAWGTTPLFSQFRSVCGTRRTHTHSHYPSG